MDLFSSFPKCAVIGHRGASAEAPENTLPAFRLAAEQGADALELDVMLTRDKEMVVVHDPVLGRTTDGRGVVHKMSLGEVREMDAGRWFSSEFAGTRIPTLKEVLLEMAPALPINIELKNNVVPFDDLPARVACLIRETGTESRVFISSFNTIALWRFRRALPEVPIGLLSLGGGARWGRLLSGLMPHEALHPAQRHVTARFIRSAHTRGLRVHSYTVNEAARIRALFDWGIDGVFTDKPALGVRIRAEVLDDET